MSTTQNNTITISEAETLQPTWEDNEKALIDVLKAGIFHNYPRDSKLIQKYKEYIKVLRNSEDNEAPC